MTLQETLMAGAYRGLDSPMSQDIATLSLRYLVLRFWQFFNRFNLNECVAIRIRSETPCKLKLF